MASADGPSASASGFSQPSSHPLQESKRPLNSDNAEIEAESSTGAPTKSLFGPFPPPSQINETSPQPTSIPDTNQTSKPISTDPIEPSTMLQQRDNEPGSKANVQNNGLSEPIPMNPISNHGKAPMPPLTREKTAPAIGPATDRPTPLPKESEIEGPVLYITLLLSSTGSRHPYKLDEKYLRKRNVTVDGNNPVNLSLYKLKELILRDWRDDWEAKPSSPDSIRLISMGKMLNDKARLSDSGFTNGTTPHIIHMTIKPQEIVDEEEAKMKAGGFGHGENDRSPGCRCIIQ